jgi:hypothetical protein
VRRSRRCPARWEKNKWVAESSKIGSVFYCSKIFKNYTKNIQNSIDKGVGVWYNYITEIEKEVKNDG